MTVTEQDRHWMGRALDMARRTAEHEVPVGAVVVLNGLELGRASNRPVGDRDPSAHAEILALREAAAYRDNYRLPGASLYVTIEPCTMCFGAMVHARIARLVYGAAEPRAGVCESRLRLPEQTFYNHHMEVRGGVLAEESAELLRAFFAARR